MNQPSESSLARGFRDVDRAAVDKLSRCLRYMDALAEFQRYKAVMMDAMELVKGAISADLGCGLGLDVNRLAHRVGDGGRAIGVDSSLALLAAARADVGGGSAAEFLQADIQMLPLADGCLHSCRIDRTLQHVQQPTAVLREVLRTLRSGGIVVCAEPDWSTFTIDVASADARDRSMAMQVAAAWRNGIRNPRIGRELGLLLSDIGFKLTKTEEVFLATPDFESSDIVFDLRQTALGLVESTRSQEPVTWVSELRERAQAVGCRVSLLIYAGRRP